MPLASLLTSDGMVVGNMSKLFTVTTLSPICEFLFFIFYNSKLEKNVKRSQHINVSSKLLAKFKM